MNAATVIKKKDDDARFIVSAGELYAETTAPLPQEPQFTVAVPNPTNEGLLEAAAVAPRTDIRIQVICTTFIAHNIASLACLAIGLPFFFWPMTRSAVVGLIVSCILQLVFYLTMIFSRKRNPNVSLGAFVGWVLTCGVIVGCASSLLGNIAPIQLMAMIWIESLIIIIYAKRSPQDISTGWALLYMCIGAVAVWGIFIAEFVIERDWISGTIILLLGLGCAVYHAFQLRMSEVHLFNASWEDMILSIAHFYGEPVILMIDKFCAN